MMYLDTEDLVSGPSFVVARCVIWANHFIFVLSLFTCEMQIQPEYF